MRVLIELETLLSVLFKVCQPARLVGYMPDLLPSSLPCPRYCRYDEKDTRYIIYLLVCLAPGIAGLTRKVHARAPTFRSVLPQVLQI